MSKIERKLPRRQVIIVVYDGVQALDVSGPAQALTTASEEGAAPPYTLRVAALSAGAVTTASGFSITAESLPRSGVIDTIFIPGGPGIHRFRANAKATAALARLFQRTRRICAVCTGAFMLAEMGCWPIAQP